MQSKLNSINRQNIAFDAEGTTLRGWLYQATESKGPIIVMAHGYNCIKELYLDKYAEVFARAGLNVLVYDHRNFGESDGLPRGELDPWVQVRDYRHAITYAQSLNFVDPNRIGIWGSSYSGGHVLVVAAIDKRVKCVVSQVPTISGFHSMQRRVQAFAWDRQLADFDEDRKNRLNGLPPKYVTMIADPANNSGTSSHASQDAWEFFTGANAAPSEKWRFERWKNEITLRSIEMYSEYEPGSYIKRIAPTPLLMQIAENDVITLTYEALEAFNQANEIKKLQLFPGGHFSAYTDQFAATSQTACEWYQQHLIHKS